MRVAYADPPYLGCCALYKHDHGEDGRCWDSPLTHGALITRLMVDYPDGWALSLSTPSLRTMLNFCPEDVRVAAWVKPFAVFKPNVNPAYAWEPVIWRGGRARRQRSEPTVRDWVSAEIALKKGLTGAKPPAFVWWLFALMGLRGNDTVIDIYPGTGVVGREWARFKRQQTLFTNGFTNDDEGTHSHPRSGVQTANALASPAATEGDRQEPRADYERDMLIGGKPLASQLNTLFVDTEGDQPTPIEPKNIYDCINCSDEAGQHWPNPNVGPFCFHCYHLLFPDPPVQP